MERYDLVVVGGGIAGISAALHGGWLGCRVLLTEKGTIGGQITNAGTLENYPGFPQGISGPELAAMTHLQAVQFGVETAYTEVSAVKVSAEGYLVHTADNRYFATSVIIATGGKRRDLGIKGESEFSGKGVSECATCDGAFFNGLPVAIIGGGDTALDEALILSEICSRVFISHRARTLDASRTLVKRAEGTENIEFLPETEAQEIYGKGSVDGMLLLNRSTNRRVELQVSCVFVCIGFDANNALLPGLLERDPQGHIRVNLDMETSVQGVFAAGYVRQQTTGQLASVVGDGVTAAMSAGRYVGSWSSNALSDA